MKTATKRGFRVIGLQCNTTMKDKETDIRRLWEGFLCSEIEGGDYFGLCFNNNPAKGTFSYLAGRKSDGPVPAGMVAMQVPGGKYAVYEHKGSLSGLDATYARVYAEVAMNMIDTERLGVEHYGKGFRDGSDKSVMEVWVPMR